MLRNMKDGPLHWRQLPQTSLDTSQVELHATRMKTRSQKTATQITPHHLCQWSTSKSVTLQWSPLFRWNTWCSHYSLQQCKNLPIRKLQGLLVRDGNYNVANVWMHEYALIQMWHALWVLNLAWQTWILTFSLVQDLAESEYRENELLLKFNRAHWLYKQASWWSRAKSINLYIYSIHH